MFRSAAIIAIVICTFTPSALIADEPLAIATFQADVTPPIGSPLCGGAVEPAKEIVDPLSARGLILFVEPAPLVLCVVDWVGIGNAAHDAWRSALADAAKTTPARVTVHAVHQHDAPGCDFAAEALLAERGLGGQMMDVPFVRAAIARTADAVRSAAAKPKPVTHLGTGQAEVEKVASNRRVLGPDGKVKHVRYTACRIPEAIAAPEGVVDPLVRILSFWNGDTPVASVTYYATHPQSHYGKGGVSADFVGMARSKREDDLPKTAHIHFNGAGGNVGAGKYNDGSPENRPVLAARLADGMKRAWDATVKKPIRAKDVEWRVEPVALPLRDTLVEADLANILDDENANPQTRITAARNLVWAKRCSAGQRIELTSLRLGSAYVVHMPGELFVEYQLAAQKMRPDDFIAMAAYSDYGPGYICTEIAYTQGGYESGPPSRTAPQVESVLMAAMKKLLQ
jgi:hypothetical protein